MVPTTQRIIASTLVTEQTWGEMYVVNYAHKWPIAQAVDILGEEIFELQRRL